MDFKMVNKCIRRKDIQVSDMLHTLLTFMATVKLLADSFCRLQNWTERKINRTQEHIFSFSLLLTSENQTAVDKELHKGHVDSQRGTVKKRQVMLVIKLD